MENADRFHRKRKLLKTSVFENEPPSIKGGFVERETQENAHRCNSMFDSFQNLTTSVYFSARVMPDP